MKKIPYKYAVALTAALGLFMAVLDNTIVNVSLTAMRTSFIKQDPNLTLSSIQWIITAYFLTQAAVIPVAGYLSTRFGVRRVFLIALGLFTFGSLLCGLSHEFDQLLGGGGLGMLIGFRVVQGLGGGMLFPLATSISFNVFPPIERAKSSAVIGVPVLLAPTLGPTVGGLIVDSPLEWPWIFFINLPIGLLAMFLISRLLKPDFGKGAPEWAKNAPAQGQGAADGSAPQSRPAAAQAPTKPQSFDWLGLILSIVGTILIVYAFDLISQPQDGSVTPQNPNGIANGWGYWLTWTLLSVGLLIIAAFSVYELKLAKDPVLDLRLLQQNTFLTATIMTWVVRAVVFGSFFILPLFLEQFRGLSAVDTGLALMPQGLGAAIGILVGSRIYDIVGPRVQVILGLIALTISSIMLIGTNSQTDGWTLLPILLIRGIGFGWSNLPLQTVALSKVGGPALAKASSLYNATAQVFSSIGIAVLSTIFTENLSSRFAEAAKAAKGKPSPQAVLEAGASAVSNVFLVVTIGTAATLLLAFLLPAKSLKQEQEAAKAKGEKVSESEAPAMIGE